MQLIFSDQALPASQTKSIFLAGPSPRNADVADWRPAAVAELQRLGFDGTVFIPIPSYRFEGWTQSAEGWTYDGQVTWERDAREMSDAIVFWVPRQIDRTREDLGMPAFTTNFELAEDLHSGKVLYGRPSDAEKVSYLDHQATLAGLTVHKELPSLMQEAVSRLGAGAFRSGGEAQVPLRVWQTTAFQTWYTNLKKAGHRLDGARVLNQVTVSRGFLFCFALKVKIWVEAEQRHKHNEFFVARPDISVVVAAYRDLSGPSEVIRVALVREFRSTVNNERGMVFEMPSGSTKDQSVPPNVNAQHELDEETGLLIEDVSRFKRVGTRQLAATFATHRAVVYTIELTEAEFNHLRAVEASGEPRGEAASMEGSTGERTYVELTTFEDVFNLPVDYSTLGMLAESLRTLGLSRI